MPMTDIPQAGLEVGLKKVPTGIKGLDAITDGGLPAGRATLACGGPGCGKTLLALEFLVNGARMYDEPGVFVSFEENEGELASNVASLGWDIPALKRQGKLHFLNVVVPRSEASETGDYTLDGLFVRLAHAVDSVGAKRVVLDTIESLFAALTTEHILRAELQRLFRWLKDQGLSAVVTGERGVLTLTRHGLEEYVSDCVVEMKHEVSEGISTRRLRVVKYRGSRHGSDEYPFLINQSGLSLLPVTAIGLDYDVENARVSTGVPLLDAMLDGKGYYKGSSILVTGTAGAGKSSLAASFIDASCRRGDRAIYISFEESPRQIMRNMRSIGIDLQQHADSGLLLLHSVRPSASGLEMHLLNIHALIAKHTPLAMVVDPISNLTTVGAAAEVKSILTRFIDLLKGKAITALFTDLTTDAVNPEGTNVGISSLMDTWILLRTFEQNGERNRGLFILKSRGMPHSNQVREFVLTNKGIELVDAYLGAEGVLMGTARVEREMQDRAGRLRDMEEFDNARRVLDRKKSAAESRIAALRAEIENDERQLARLLEQNRAREEASAEGVRRLAALRFAAADRPGKGSE